MPTGDLQHLRQLMARLALGDRAFLFHFILGYEQPVSGLLVAAGFTSTQVPLLVHEVALRVMELAIACPVGASCDPWALVTQAVNDQAESNNHATEIGGRMPNSAAGFVGRSVHLVDVENLAGGPGRIDEWFAPAMREYLAVTEPGAADHLVMAADVNLWRRTAFDVPEFRYLAGFGPDGADRALLEDAPVEWIVSRFDRLVIGSGDHAFTDLARAVKSAGTKVVVVARPDQLARSLRLAADEVMSLPNLPDLPCDPLMTSSHLPRGGSGLVLAA
ncbi:MAG: NYN domain-containing protein [Actinomycetes bacterium]